MVISTIIINVMSSAAEAERGALFYNATELEALRNILIDMVHPQQSTKIITENSTADVIMKGTILKKLTKATDMKFYWVCD